MPADLETFTVLFTATGDAIDAPRNVQALWKQTTPIHWAAQFPHRVLSAYGVTPTPVPRGVGTLDAASVVVVDSLNVQGTLYEVAIGTGTAPAVACMAAALGSSRAFTGPETLAQTPLAARLRALQNQQGRRIVRSLRRISDNAEASFIAPHGVAGHDRFVAAVPTGARPDDFEPEPDGR